MGMSGFDLRKFQQEGVDEEQVKKIFGKMLSGKDGYETVLDKNKPVKKCSCGTVVEDCKFCPECGASVQVETNEDRDAKPECEEKICSEQFEAKDKLE